MHSCNRWRVKEGLRGSRGGVSRKEKRQICSYIIRCWWQNNSYHRATQYSIFFFRVYQTYFSSTLGIMQLLLVQLYRVYSCCLSWKWSIYQFWCLVWQSAPPWIGIVLAASASNLLCYCALHLNNFPFFIYLLSLFSSALRYLMSINVNISINVLISVQYNELLLVNLLLLPPKRS